ncbi:MAG TPA: metalloregulator ArsR/SmtB family transcription factor [Anaerolineales bacterium]|nr:metalloregulator ArsR/SmtB family transcription factor [Anaerolineales bacterium]
MNEVKESKLTEQELRLARMFKALGNPVRLEILRKLSDCNSCICGDIVDALPLAQSTVSQHLKVLKEAGLIRGEIEGPATCYCIDQEGLDWLKSKLPQFF